MTSHELARKLLAVADLPVSCTVECDGDAVTSAGGLRLVLASRSGDKLVFGGEGHTEVCVVAKTEQEFLVQWCDG